MTKPLIINADDFGCSQTINRAIVRGYRQGLIRSASLVMNGPETPDALTLMRECPELEVGLHCNISTFRCLAACQNVKSLVHDNGAFTFITKDLQQSIIELRNRFEHDQSLVQQIRIELEAQLAAILATGIFLSHINFHHYLPLIHPDFYALYEELCLSAGVPGRTLVVPITQALCSRSDIRLLTGISEQNKGLVTPTVSISCLREFARAKIGSEEYATMVLDLLRLLAGESAVRSVELIVHLDAAAENQSTADDYQDIRNLETNLVFDQTFHSRVSALGYRLSGYAALGQENQTSAWRAYEHFSYHTRAQFSSYLT